MLCNVSREILQFMPKFRKCAVFIARCLLRRVGVFLFIRSPDTQRLFARYWRAYGGVSALMDSFYFRASFLLTIALAPVWWKYDWTTLALSSSPSLLGFSIAAYTAILAFSDRDFVDFIIIPDFNPDAQNSDNRNITLHDLETSGYMNLNSTFVHFIVMQVVAFISAIFCNAVGSIEIKILYLLVSSVSFLIFIYSILLAVAATMGVFRIAFIYQAHRRKKINDKIIIEYRQEPLSNSDQ